MENEFGSIFWFLAVVGGAVILGIAIAIASFQWRRRRQDPAIKARQRKAVDEIYHSEERDGDKVPGPH